MIRSIALSLVLLAACAGPQDLPRPAWPDQARAELRQVAANAQAEGLPAETAAVAELDLYEGRLDTDAAAAQQLDMVADELFARLAHTFTMGALEPEAVDPSWRLPNDPTPDVQALRAEAWRLGVQHVLTGLLPASADYAVLRAELAHVEAEPDDAADDLGRSKAARIASLRASMERWRWLPIRLPDDRVEARIAQFQVVLFEGGRPVETHAAIVGARATQTPAFSAEIDAVTLNPSWTVPRSILVNELLPRFRRDPAEASRLGYEVIDAAGRVYDPAQVDWSGRFPYTLRRRPGAGNPLGQLKFEMVNPYDVYLHDTSSRQLFSRSDRALSHGCIRVAEPEDLALRVLGPAWDRAGLESAIGAGTTRSLPISEPTPFYAIYMTASVSADGVVAYADDIYARDANVVAMLDSPEASLVASVSAPQGECAP